MQNILIIDKNQEETELLRAVLEEEYTVKAVPAIEEGIACAGTGNFSLIFLEASLDDIEEFTRFKELQGKIMPWHIPVILLLDQPDVKKEEQALSLGAADYIVRPAYPLVVKARAYTHISLYQYRKKEEQQSSMTDSLTGVASKQRYERNSVLKWQEAVRLGVPVSICLIDIDRFREYNNRYGYPAGDQVLISVAETVSSYLKRSTDLFARYGGDRFAAIILGGEKHTVFAHMKKICEVVEKLHIPHWASGSGWITVSVGGVTVIPEKEDAYSTYFEIAENSLSDAKKSGRSQIVWTDERMEPFTGK